MPSPPSEPENDAMADDTMILHHASLSPFARKVRVCIGEFGLADRVEMREVTVAPGKPNPEYAGLVNPLRRVPSLTLPDGFSLTDSALICQYLDELAGHRLVPREGDRRWRVLNAHAVATGMTEAAVQLRYETFLRPEPQRWATWSDDLKDKIRGALDWFEARAGDGSRAPELDLGIVALVCGLDYIDFRHPDIAWRDGHPRLEAEHALLAERESFASTRPQA